MVMNSIQGLLDRSDYRDNWDYVNFYIDGYWLDEKLEELCPGSMYKGLIPTLTYGMDKHEEVIVWSRILPNENETTVCPILMCPDDFDFSCTLIVVQIRNCGNVIQWDKIGVDLTDRFDVNAVGTNVDWFDKVEPLIFYKEEYLTMIASFQNQMEIDKKFEDEQ